MTLDDDQAVTAGHPRADKGDNTDDNTDQLTEERVGTSPRVRIVGAIECTRHDRVTRLTVPELGLTHDQHYLADHTHLNAAGHERMAALFTKAARKLVGAA